MPVKSYLILIVVVIAASILTLALAHWAGALALLAPVALVLAWVVRRST